MSCFLKHCKNRKNPKSTMRRSEQVDEDLDNGKSAEKVKATAGNNDAKKDDLYSAYLNISKALKTGISHDEMLDTYNHWASAYDEDLCLGRYNGPEIAAKAVNEHYTGQNVEGEQRAKLRILDVAAGTGRVGVELVKFGFRNLDALEPCDGMLSKLKEKTCEEKAMYSVIYQCAVGVASKNDVPSDIYDCLVVAGGMGEGHIPVSALDEMIHFVRPGGTFFIAMREEYLWTVKEYEGRLEPYMEQLEERGLWKRITRQVVPNFCFDKNGVVFSYQVLPKSE